MPLRVLQNGGAPEATPRDAAKAEEIDACREFVTRKLTRRMLRVLGGLQDRYRDAVTDEAALAQWEFPLLPGSHLHMTNPTLEFVKFSCAVFAHARSRPAQAEPPRARRGTGARI